MVPSFMSREQAAQILATGKSVVFMRDACADDSARADHAHLLQALLTSAAGKVQIFLMLILYSLLLYC